MSSNHFLQWLHISDLHIGHPNSPWLDETMLHQLCDYLKDNVKQIDFIIMMSRSKG